MSNDYQSSVKYQLKPEDELRFEVAKGKTISLKLLNGTAEIFGTEIAKDREYKFSFTQVAVFTWHGCEVEITGQCNAYVANETPMIIYANLHGILEERRVLAAKNGTMGPKVLIAGLMDTGKSTLAKILLGYAARCGRKCIYADLDIGQNGITIPSMVAAVSVDRPIDVEEGLSSSAPLVYFYGHVSLDQNEALFKRQLSVLSTQINRRFSLNPDVASSGSIINTCGWVDGMGYQLLLYSIQTFQADVIFVLDNERLYNDLLRELKDRPQISVVKLPKSGGVMTRTTEYRKTTRSNKIHQYFYGTPMSALSPHQTVVSFNDVVIYKVGGGPQAPLSALPIGAESSYEPLRLVSVLPSQEIVHSILSVTTSQDGINLLDCNIAGFLYITQVDFERRKIHFLSPRPGPLPSKYLLLGSVEYLE